MRLPAFRYPLVAGSESISGVSLTKQLQSFAPNCFVACSW
jgi:hypothetical protein